MYACFCFVCESECAPWQGFFLNLRPWTFGRVKIREIERRRGSDLTMLNKIKRVGMFSCGVETVQGEYDAKARD